MAVIDFADGVAVTFDVTPENWWYPSRKPERLYQVNQALESLSCYAFEFNVGVKRVTVSCMFDDGLNIDAATFRRANVREKLERLAQEWKAADLREFEAADCQQVR